MITNYQLLEVANKIKIPLVGVYNKDTLPKQYRDGGYIINLQDSTDEHGNDLPGTHWTAFYLEDKDAAYFDSFGFVPPQQVEDFLKSKYNVLVSHKQIQNVQSEICGYYCLYFIYWMFHYKKLKFADRFHKFVNKFSDDVKKNKTLLEKYIKPL